MCIYLRYRKDRSASRSASPVPAQTRCVVVSIGLCMCILCVDYMSVCRSRATHCYCRNTCWNRGNGTPCDNSTRWRHSKFQASSSSSSSSPTSASTSTSSSAHDRSSDEEHFGVAAHGSMDQEMRGVGDDQGMKNASRVTFGAAAADPGDGIDLTQKIAQGPDSSSMSESSTSNTSSSSSQHSGPESVASSSDRESSPDCGTCSASQRE